VSKIITTNRTDLLISLVDGTYKVTTEIRDQIKELEEGTYILWGVNSKIEKETLLSSSGSDKEICFKDKSSGAIVVRGVISKVVPQKDLSEYWRKVPGKNLCMIKIKELNSELAENIKKLPVAKREAIASNQAFSTRGIFPKEINEKALMSIEKTKPVVKKQKVEKKETIKIAKEKQVKVNPVIEKKIVQAKPEIKQSGPIMFFGRIVDLKRIAVFAIIGLCVVVVLFSISRAVKSKATNGSNTVNLRGNTITIGENYLEKKDYNSMISYFDKSKTDRTEVPNKYYYQGIAFYKKGELYKAEQMFKKIIGINPFFTQAYYYLALSLYDQGREHTALGYIKKATSLNEKSQNNAFNKGITFLTVGKGKQALREFKQEKETKKKKTIADKILVEGYISYCMGATKKTEVAAKKELKTPPIKPIIKRAPTVKTIEKPVDKKPVVQKKATISKEEAALLEKKRKKILLFQEIQRVIPRAEDSEIKQRAKEVLVEKQEKPQNVAPIVKEEITPVKKKEVAIKTKKNIKVTPKTDSVMEMFLSTPMGRLKVEPKEFQPVELVSSEEISGSFEIRFTPSKDLKEQFVFMEIRSERGSGIVEVVFIDEFGNESAAFQLMEIGSYWTPFKIDISKRAKNIDITNIKTVKFVLLPPYDGWLTSESIINIKKVKIIK